VEVYSITLLPCTGIGMVCFLIQCFIYIELVVHRGVFFAVVHLRTQHTSPSPPEALCLFLCTVVANVHIHFRVRVNIMITLMRSQSLDLGS